MTKMKKIIAILLAAVCLVSLAACGGDGDGTTTTTTEPAIGSLSGLDKVNALISRSAPTKVEMNIVYDPDVLELTATSTITIDASQTPPLVKYELEYDKLNELGSGEDSYKTTVKVDPVISSGDYLSAQIDGKYTWIKNTEEVVFGEMSIGASDVEEHSDAEGVYTIRLKDSAVTKIFGSGFGGTGVTLVINYANDQIVSLSLSYTQAGKAVSATAAYSYDAQTITIGE